MSMWIRTIALALTALWLVGCSGVAQRQVAQDAVTAMGGADKLMAIQSLIMSGGTGTRTKVGQAMTATGMDQTAQLTNNVETLDLANGRAAYDYDLVLGDFKQHRHEVLTKFGEGDAGLVVAVAHLSLGAQSRRSQLDFIADVLDQHEHAVLMGDFNCPPDSAEMLQLYRRTRLQPPECVVATFPSWRPQRAIDHILVTPGLGGCTGHRALAAAASDHLALSIELDVPEAALQA